MTLWSLGEKREPASCPDTTGIETAGPRLARVLHRACHIVWDDCRKERRFPIGHCSFGSYLRVRGEKLVRNRTRPDTTLPKKAGETRESAAPIADLGTYCDVGKRERERVDVCVCYVCYVRCTIRRYLVETVKERACLLVFTSPRIPGQRWWSHLSLEGGREREMSSLPSCLLLFLAPKDR
ncbi:hypothetical protein LY76DRAFT_333701 [Colletotrichum caudatum]|nr:hypothetical protein LY76DRAFT_333701 [Colletotrichum caudatum]